MDIITYALVKNYVTDIINHLPKGIIYRGAVDYLNDLPIHAEIGDAYTVNYQGDSGTISDGNEYVWGVYQNTPQWIQLGPDISQYQLKLTESNQLSSDYVNDEDKQHKFVTSAMYDYLEGQLYLYPEIVTFVCYDNENRVIDTTLEIGDSVTIYKIKHRETNIENIKFLRINGQDITPTDVDVDNTITLDIPINITQTTNVQLIGENTRDSAFYKNLKFSINTYDYTKVSNSAITPIGGLQKQTANNYNITYNINDYIYFYSQASNKTIEQKVGDQWNPVQEQRSLGKLSDGIILSNGTQNTNYYGYVIGPFTEDGGTDTYRLH